MAGAHEELRAGDPATLTVTSVAARWGFFHPGRFAASYRAVYGRTPSETLHGLRSVDGGPLGASPDVLTCPPEPGRQWTVRKRRAPRSPSCNGNPHRHVASDLRSP
ncbi:hypothetical protein GCM10020001_044720 [Nonomuraea salmonea]